MTERNKYNNLWADKLQEVSLPDAGEGWMSMELILDKEMPLGRTKDRRRWLLLILLLLLLIGVCNCPGTGRWFDSIRTGSPASTTSAPTHAPPPASVPPVPSTATPVVPVTAPAVPVTVPSGVRSTPTPAVPRTARPIDSVTSPAAPAVGTPSTAASLVTPRQTNSVVPTPSSPTTIPPSKKVRSSSKPSPVKSPTVPGHSTAGAPTSPGLRANSGVDLVSSPHSGALKSSGSTPRTQTTRRRQPADTAARASRPRADSTPHTNRGPSDTATQANRPPTDTGTHVNRPPIKPGTPVANHPTPARQDTARKKPAPAPEDSTEIVKGWMAGIGLNQFFPIGGQTASNYNSSGISGTLSDYIPIPMVRYYFSKKLFIQLEAQFNTPQYTKSNLTVANTIPDTSAVTVRTVTSVVSLKKLFYFNLPLSVHYNFSDHFAFGAGLQFSRLTNAVGFFDNNVLTPGGPDSASTETKSFKGDSIYQRIKTDEFRFLVDFGYTWEHFIVGLRYNQALTKFVDIQIKPGQITQGRNSSLQLYLRYILWDGRKKKLSFPK